MTERGLENHPGTDNLFYGEIPNLVKQSLTGRPDKARKAKKELAVGLTADPFYDSTFLAFEAIQRSIANEKNPTAARNALLFLGELLDTAATSLTQMEIKELRNNTQTAKAAEEIITNNTLVQRNRYLQGLIQQIIPKGYKNMLQAAELVKSTRKGESILLRARSSVSDKDKIKEEQEQQLLADWYNSLIFQTQDWDSYLTISRDNLVNALKAEPKLKSIPRQRLISRNITGLSIEGIEEIAYPPSDQQLDNITNYLAGVFSAPMANRDRNLIENLFFGSIFFTMEPHGTVHYRNFNLLANINLWQERFVQRLLQDHDQQREEQAKIILQGISKPSAGMLLYNALQFVSHPLEHDPDFTGDNSEERYVLHPFFNQALAEFRRTNPGETFIYADEIGTRYFQTTVLPLLEHRLKYFGVARKFADIITLIKTELREKPFSEAHFAALKDYFEEHCGQEFLKRLNSHSDNIKAITRSAWQFTLEKGFHYLPMQQGFNLIEFSEGSVPDILGITSVTVNTSGSPQEWKESITFRLLGTSIAINGRFDQEGKLVLKAPLEARIPGLYILLNHIAVLAFHDLVIQERKEREKQIKKDENRTLAGHQQPRTGSPHDKLHSKDLPRIQTDTQLILDVYHETNQTPRRVELHKRRLPGNDDYLTAISLYEKAKTDTELAIAATELKKARDRARKASDSKVRDLPAKFSLGKIQDPITHNVRYFETWVVEHTSPKPTEEELKSPVKLFERYYKNSSALASLDQLKPWFVGE